MSDAAVRARRLQVVAAGAQLAHIGLIQPGEGNISVRVDDQYFLITMRGVDKGRMAAAQLVMASIVDHCSLPTESSESPLHRAVYRTYSEVNAVVHAHPRSIQQLAIANQVPDCSLLLEAKMVLPGVGWAGSFEPGSPELAQAVSQVLVHWPACVLYGHGAVTVGTTLPEAVRRMILLERLAALTVGAVES